MKPKKPFPLYCCLLITSIILIIIGFILLFIWPLISNYIIQSSFILKPNSPTYPVWKKTPFPIQMDFYFFNWTNPHEIYNDTIKPRVQQLGPYRYKLTKEKVNITWNDNNNTVTYRFKKHWFYDTNFTETSLNDEITTLNTIALSATYSARDWNYVLKKGLALSLKSMSPAIHVTRTVNQLLFEGYPDPLLNMAKTLSYLTNAVAMDRFGWFYKRNGSTEADGIFNMGTGMGTKFGKLYEWNHWNQTPYYPGECGKVQGSAGELFGTNLSKSSIALFSSDICRNMKLDYVQDVNVKNILGHKYSAGPSLLDNGTFVPENACYCNGECVPSGALNVSACRHGSPAFVSLPHFYNADPYYTDIIDGLNPDKNKHEFFMILEPTTGVPLQVSVRLQLNLLLQPVTHVPIYENIPKVFFPVLWFEQVITIPDGMAFNLKLLLNLNVICTSIAIVLICIGLIIMSCTIYKICTTNICGKKKKSTRMTASIHEQEPLRTKPF